MIDDLRARLDELCQSLHRIEAKLDDLLKQAPPRKPEALLSSKEVARHLGVSVATLRRMCEDRAVTFIRVTAREYKFELAELETFKNARFKRKSLVR
jgi:excisionase family DNA binding protein